MSTITGVGLPTIQSSVSAFAPLPGPRPGQKGELVELGRIIGDETGKYSDDDKNKASIRFQEIAYTNLFDYSLEERQEYTALTEGSSYRKRVQAAEEKYGRFQEQYLMNGKRGPGIADDIARLKAQVAFFDQLTPFEKSIPSFDGVRERAIALIGMKERMQARVDAGAFVYGTPKSETRDPEAKLILDLYDNIMSIRRRPDGTTIIPPEFAPYMQRGYELLGKGGFGTIQDTISLSPQARRAMGA